MRSVLTISIPPSQRESVEKRASKAKKTLSAYVLDALELAENMISEDELLAMAKRAEKDYKKGKTTAVASLADLMK